MKIKTYCVDELSEWYGQLKVGTIAVSVSFTGGTVSPSGSQAAYMVTKDPIVQFVVENSKEFKSGFIKLQTQQELPGEHPHMAKPRGLKKEDAGSENDTDVQMDGRTDETAVVKVSDRNEAIEWLKEHYPDRGYTVRGLRSNEAFAAACSEVGVRFDMGEV